VQIGDHRPDSGEQRRGDDDGGDEGKEEAADPGTSSAGRGSEVHARR